MFKKMKTITKLVPVVAVTILGLLTANVSSAQQLTRVTFVSPSPSAINSFQIFVAMGEGYFKDEGIEIKAEAVNGSGPVLQALTSGQAQLGRPGPALAGSAERPRPPQNLRQRPPGRAMGRPRHARRAPQRHCRPG